MLSKLAYVVIREDLDSPIIRSQVIDILSQLSEISGEFVTLVWFYRVDYLIRKKGRIWSLVRELRSDGIELVPIPFFSLKFPVSWYLVPLVLPQWLIGAAWVWWSRRIRVFHCRSYHAALMGACAKLLLPIQLIFDPRSPFPEENLVPEVWGKIGPNYHFWKKAEQYICRKSDVVLAISEPFKHSLAHITPSAPIVVVPNNYPTSFMQSNKVASRSDAYKKPETICYIGSLGNWNAFSSYASFIKYVANHSSIVAGAKFIVPSEYFDRIRQEIQADVYLREAVSLLSVDQGCVIEEMSDCIVGMQIMSRPDDRLSIKFVEYLAAGVPVIVSENVRGAAWVVGKYGVGFVLKSDMSNVDDAVEFIEDACANSGSWRKKCADVAARLYSPRVVADELVKVYASIR